MPAPSDALRALDLIEASNFQMTKECEAAHEIAQAHEGEALFDAIHALVHRIEGDPGNAAYWDRRAGTDFGSQGFVSELAQLNRMAGRE